MLLLLLACSPTPRGITAPSSQPFGEPAVDLVSPLGPDEARAGEITDEEALFGGLAAEGQAGDFKLYNDRAQFVIQGLRDGGYYLRDGGGLLDADIVRGPGEPGRDLVDEFAVMVGLGRIIEPAAIRVVSQGGPGVAAVVEVVGQGAPLSLLTGALEQPDFVEEVELVATTRYTLSPGSPLLAVETTVEWQGAETPLLIGDLGFFAQDGADNWDPGRGLDADGEADGSWFGALGWKNEGAFALLSEDGLFPPSPITSVLEAVGPVMVGLQPSTTLGPGDTFTFRRYFGVGADLAEITDAWYVARGLSTTTVSGRVEADGVPVEGARVTLFDADERPITLAITGVDGGYVAEAPGVVAVQASGRGHNISADLPPGAGWSAPYAADPVDARTWASLRGGATPIPMAEGYGLSTVGAPGEALQLTPPGVVAVDVGDGRPAVVRLDFVGGDPVPAAPMVALPRPGGSAGLLFLRDGVGEIAVEPGDYTLVVHRGYRFEAFTQSVHVERGGRVEVAAPLVQVVAPTGALVLDPHAHAGPSNDSFIPMEDRLVVTAAEGIDVHFGTDHDHVADYAALIEPLGLQDVLRSVIADEVSPVLRGHFNIYPLAVIPDRPNNGAPLWFENTWDTPALFEQMRARVGDGVLQVNHPAGSKGMFGHAGYVVTEGTIASASHWATDFDAEEVLNSGEVNEYLPFYLDLTARGLWPTPVGVSDSHSHTDGQGDSVTYLLAGVDRPGDLDDGRLVEAMKARATVVSRGPYIEATIGGERAPGGLFTGQPTLSVEVWAPSWVSVSALDLLRDGVVVETVAVDPDATAGLRARASFDLAGDADAVYILIARGERSMAPVYPGRTAWAMTSALRVDRAGDGWTPPLPSLVVVGE